MVVFGLGQGILGREADNWLGTAGVGIPKIVNIAVGEDDIPGMDVVGIGPGLLFGA
jgi:hypothetical protein